MIQPVSVPSIYPLATSPDRVNLTPVANPPKDGLCAGDVLWRNRRRCGITIWIRTAVFTQPGIRTVG